MWEVEMGREEASEGKADCKLKRVALKAVIEDVANQIVEIEVSLWIYIMKVAPRLGFCISV
jgi:hypothetical protein